MKITLKDIKDNLGYLAIAFAYGFGLMLLLFIVSINLVGFPLELKSILSLHLSFYSVWFFDLIPLLAVIIALYFKISKNKVLASNDELNNKINMNAIRLMNFSADIKSKKFDTALKIVDDNDAVGQVMTEIQNAFTNYINDENIRNWVVNGKQKITTILQENTTLKDLTFATIKHLSDYTGAVQGAFYTAEKAEEDEEGSTVLKMISRYAYNRMKYEMNEFKIGEGLVGECAFEKDTILRTEIPSDFVSITSGLIEDNKPNAILLVPVINNDELLGVMEFATLLEFNQDRIQLIEEVAEMLSRAIFNIQTNEKTLNMLHEAQKMSEDLQTQQEMLRQNAEEMQAGQEELQRVNSELEVQFTEIENSQRRQYSLLENASEMITIYNEAGEIQYESPAVLKILGYTPEEMMGSNIKSRIHEKGLETIEKAFKDLIKYPNKTQKCQFTYIRKNGERIWLEAIGRNLIKDKAINGIVFNSRDITLHRKAEKEQILRGRMQALSENSEDIIMRLDKEGILHYVNPIIEKYLGLKPKAIKEKDITTFDIDDSTISIWKEIVLEAYKTESKQEREMTFKTAEETYVMHINVMPEYSEDGKMDTVLMVSHDITERKKIELLIQDKNEKITQSINYAQRIQTAILPDNKVIRKYLPESFMYYKPKDVVSGDFPWFYEKGDELYLAAVDCTGHGVPGAMMSLIGYFLLNEINSHTETLAPSVVLDKLDEAVRTTLRQDDPNSESRDGMDVGICKINLKEMKIEYAGAHRPLFFIRRGNLEEYKGNRKAIGGKKMKDEVFVNYELDIKKGDTIYYFSDGLPDQFGGPEQKKYSPRRIREMVVNNADKTMPQINQLFEKDFEKWMSTYKQIDDVLLIGIRF